METLTKKEIRVILEHISIDLSYGKEGTFNRINSKDDFVFNGMDAKIAERACEKLRILSSKLK